MLRVGGHRVYGGCTAAPVATPTLSKTRAASCLLDCRRPVRVSCSQSFSNLRNLHHVAPAVFTAASPASERERGISVTAALPIEFSDIPPAAVGILSSALSFGLLRAFVYFRMEYIIAAMLGRHVPRGGAKVVELDIREGRNLYYYPSDTVQVVAVTTNPNRTLLENQAIKAGVPIQIKTHAPSTLGLTANTMDAVVSVYAFRDIPDREVTKVLREAYKVLQPGKPFIFVEPVGAKNPVVKAAQKAFQGVLNMTGSKRSLTRDFLQYVQEVEGFEDVEYEEVFSFLDPHIVGVAKKKLNVESAKKTLLTKTQSESNSSLRQGFKKSKT